MAQYLKHKRSSQLVDGAPKLPTVYQIGVGEIAINFAAGHETLSTVNSNNDVVTFSSDTVLDSKYISSGAVVSAISAVTKTIEDNEYVVAQALNELHDDIEDLQDTVGNIPSNISDLNDDIGIPDEASIIASGFTKNALTAYTETDPTVPAWAKAESKPTYTAAEVGALSSAATYFDDAEYDSNTKRINFKKNNTVVDYIDATDFIKDGMVSSVTVSNDNLVMSFNTDAGREDITLSLAQIFNPNNYYDKTAADAKFLSAYTETDPTVPAWAKESSKPSYTASEVGALPSTTHVPTEASIIDSGFTKNALTAYTETDPVFTGSPAYGITSQNISDWNAKQAAISDLAEIRYNAASGFSVLNTVNQHTGNTAVHLPTVSASDNGKVLQVVNGAWSLVTPVAVYNGTGQPSNQLGNNGDIYIQTS